MTADSVHAVHFPQYPVLKHPQSSFFLSMRDQVSHPHKTKCKIIVLFWYLKFQRFEPRQVYWHSDLVLRGFLLSPQATALTVPTLSKSLHTPLHEIQPLGWRLLRGGETNISPSKPRKGDGEVEIYDFDLERRVVHESQEGRAWNTPADFWILSIKQTQALCGVNIVTVYLICCFNNSGYSNNWEPAQRLATGWTIGGSGFDFRWGPGIFLFDPMSRLALGPTQPIHWVRGALSLGVKRPGREADHSPPSSAEVACLELYIHSPNTSSWRTA
jgi:hypothetical protein